ncbi:farnesyl-diphosphate farnesyltransferase [Ramaria rubella]|nr:farnesyl-diphosphate farnesyltransferase [Ramaria rubella]
MDATHILSLILQPSNIPTLFKLYRWKKTRRDITAASSSGTSGWTKASMRRCWEFLDMTSTTFSAVTKQLEGDMGKVICIFYLVLRALDTVEDDMSLPSDLKQSLLRSFHEKITQDGWNFDGSGPNEKDRQLLLEFEVVVEELNLLQPAYRQVISEICRVMETGMAEFCLKSAVSVTTVDTIDDLDVYCHHVAGIVGQGLSKLFSINGIEAHWLSDQMTLSNSWGLFLQKINILRDFREDIDDSRCFWPRNVWTSHGFNEPRELCDPENETEALYVLSEMAVEALSHVKDVLDYMSLLRNPSVFEFVAIPTVMAMATLQLCFMNKDVFHRNIKPSKKEALKVIVNLTNISNVSSIFAAYAKQIRQQGDPADPSYSTICKATFEIEAWYSSHDPSLSGRCWRYFMGNCS